jgi:DNA-binding IclR family transcriptional regulator
MAQAAESNKYHVPNLERALTILEHMAGLSQAVSMAELAKTLGYPNNSVFRIVSTLEDKGYLRRDSASKEYTLSPKMLSLGYQAFDESTLIERSFDVMRTLRDLSGETVLMGTLLESEGVVLEQMLSSQPIKFTVSPGTRFNLHTAAPAKAMLAYMSEAERDLHLETIRFEKCTSHTITSKRAYLAELKKVRELGYGVDNEEEVEGILCIGAPVIDFKGIPRAAIWVTGPKYRMEKRSLDEFGQMVKAQAARISRRLGGQE